MSARRLAATPTGPGRVRSRCSPGPLHRKARYARQNARSSPALPYPVQDEKKRGRVRDNLNQPLAMLAISCACHALVVLTAGRDVSRTSARLRAAVRHTLGARSPDSWPCPFRRSRQASPVTLTDETPSPKNRCAILLVVAGNQRKFGFGISASRDNTFDGKSWHDRPRAGVVRANSKHVRTRVWVPPARP